MLSIRRVMHLARHLSVAVHHLERVIEEKESYCEELKLFDPAKPQKTRRVLNIIGPFRKLQEKMLRSVLLPKLKISPHSHGGVTNRDIKSNVQTHVGSTFAYVTDISDFYPTISHNRVYRLFIEEFDCTPDVARLCTQLCTFRYHLALGLPTSPILADQVLRKTDQRIGLACQEARLVYTRFVDDLTVSGSFDLAPSNSGIPTLIGRILNDHGFTVNSGKDRFGRIDDDFAITKIRIRNGRLDVRRAYFDELVRQINDMKRLASGGEFQGPYFTQAQITGRARFVCWVNPGRKRQLFPALGTIDWPKAESEARRRGLVASTKKLRPVKPG